MAKYIKSYSNYVLKTKHQNTSDGTIFERDITTIGGRDQFSKGQTPIYKSGNFVITINDDTTEYAKTSEKDWHRSDAGDVWTLNVLKNYEKDEKSSDDRKIVIKKDYYDFRDYAYYGSCSELIRSSINNIIKTYPGELIVPYSSLYIANDGSGVQYSEETAKYVFGDGGYYKKIQGVNGYYSSFDLSGATEDEKVEIEEGKPYTREFMYIVDDYGNKVEKNLVLIDNPFGINIHDKIIPQDTDALKYFANGGVDNYVGYIRDSIDDEWSIDSEHEYTVSIESINLYNDINCVDVGGYIGKVVLCFVQNDYTFKTTPGLQRDPQTGEPIQILCDGSLEFDINGGEGKYNGEDTKIESFNLIGTSENFNVSSNGGNSCSNTFTANIIANKSTDCSHRMTIYMLLGDNNEVKYFVDNDDLDNFNIRIRPNSDIINDYFNNLDLFEKVLLNRNSSPLYTSTFEVIEENEDGFYTTLKQFTFPTSYGGYNLGSATNEFNLYVNELVNIGNYYDDLFTDNLWRSMTHEAIKNFDWTYTRHYTPGEEEPFVEGGTKIQKIIRLYGREFDEINHYIEAIDDLNTVTYDNINNLPDYFFTDKLEEDGWDVKLIHPLVLSEFINENDNVPVDINSLFPEKYSDKERTNKISTEDAEKLNYFYDSLGNKISIKRVFNQDFSEMTVIPYSNSNIKSIRKTKCCIEDGQESVNINTSPGYVNCPADGESTINLNISTTETCNENVESVNIDVNPGYVNCPVNGEASISLNITSEVGEDASKGYYNDCCEFIKIYSNENEYTSSDVNNEFMKRLLLNNKEIWRHKGTVEGIEMLLSLFGLRSKNRVFTDEKYFTNQKNASNGETNAMFDIDYNIDGLCADSFIVGVTAEEGECLSLTNNGKEYYKNYGGNLNLLYDYDIKEYTMFTTNEEDTWLPNKNMYLYDWVNTTKSITYNTNDFKNGKYISYQGLPLSFKEDKEAKKRYLYPHFDSKGIYDGNPYYQMNGGWVGKKPFMFDSHNNIIPEDYYGSDSKKIFTETVKNIKCVQTLQELLYSPSLASKNGDVCQVNDLSGRYAIIDGILYPIESEHNDVDDENSNIFFYANITNGVLSVGNAFFTDYVVISNPHYENNKQRIDLSDEFYKNRTIKIYILKDDDESYDIDVYSSESSINTFNVFENGKYMEGDNYTNYFKINNTDYYNELSVLGWQQLRDDEYEYFILSSIVDDSNGNNPHNGHMNYDNGYEYLTYFDKVFKYSSENDLIDYRKYSSDDDFQLLDEARNFGFSNILNSDSCNKNYDEYLREDNKCHYFGEIKLSNEEKNDCNNIRKGLSCFSKRSQNNCSPYYGINDIYRKALIDDSTGVPNIKLLKYGSVYGSIGENGNYDESKFTSVTDQIINTKRMEIEFFIRNNHEYSKEWLEEVKYIDSVIMPYLTQMIPSTVIFSVKYTTLHQENWEDENNVYKTDNFDATPTNINCDGNKTVNIKAKKA